jgi:OOP family OmpA-OmpF porin
MLRNSDAGLLITGHTDSKGSDEYNKALGYRRAQSVQLYFETKGFPPGKITIDSKGEKEPAEDNITDEGREKNRRTSVKIKN